MSMSQTTCIQNFVNGKRWGTSSNMFIEGDVLYSYGKHFPLLVRMERGFLQNADRYSVTTSVHQAACRKIATCLIPFSALSAAGISFYAVKLMDKTEERTDERQGINKDGEKYTIYERRPESVLFNTGGVHNYLASMDSNNYFLSELPGKPGTVAEAFDLLRPVQVTGEEGKDYFRQGEWFFVPYDGKVKSIGKGSHFFTEDRKRWDDAIYKYRERIIDIPLKSKNMQPHHFATEYGKAFDGKVKIPIVRGTVRHTGGDHKTLKLGDGRQWFKAYESKHVMSWGVSGKVD